MSWGAVAGAAVGVVGGALSSKGSGKGQTTDNAPWAAQQPYLQNGFMQGQDALTNSLNMGTYSGPRVASLNPYTTQGADFAASFAQKYGMPAAQQLMTSGQGFLADGTKFSGNASDIYSKASGDPTQAILANANSYANNPYVDGVIDSANRDTVRGLNEDQLPTLARNASGSGNTNSTRTGVQSAILQRGAADRMADTASNIRSQFFGKGLDMAQTQYNTDLDNRLRANNQLLQSFQQGGNSILQGQQVGGNAFDASTAAGGIYQGQNQAELDAAQKAFQEKQNTGLDLIGKYQSIINGNYGGTSTSYGPGTNPWAAALQGGIGGASAGAGIWGKLGGYNTSTPVSDGYTSYTPAYGADSGFNSSGGIYDTGSSNNPVRGGS